MMTDFLPSTIDSQADSPPRASFDVAGHESLPELQCTPLAIYHDFTQGVGELVVAEGERPDMDGAVVMFKRIDPHVRQIGTVAGGTFGPVFTRTNAGWRAA